MGGRRAGERRLASVTADAPELPRRALRYASQISFVERLEPSAQEAEDDDTARLVARFQGGDDDAFAALYARFFDRAYAYLRVLLKDAHEAEDAAQQVFVKLLQSLPSYERREQPFRGWFFTVVRNVAFDSLRRSGKLVLEDNASLERRLEARPQPEPGLDSLSWVADRDLVVLLERLTLPQRQVLLLRYMLGLSSAEAGAVLGRSAEDVRVLQHRALRFLETRLTALGRAPIRRDRTRMRTAKRHAPVLRTRRFALMR